MSKKQRRPTATIATAPVAIEETLPALCACCHGYGYTLYVRFVRYTNGMYRHEWQVACSACAGDGVVRTATATVTTPAAA